MLEAIEHICKELGGWFEQHSYIMVTIGYDYDTLIDPTKGRRTESTTIYI